MLCRFFSAFCSFFLEINFLVIFTSKFHRMVINLKNCKKVYLFSFRWCIMILSEIQTKVI